MARAALTVQTINRTGLSPSYTNATVDGHFFDNASEEVFLHVKNDSASPITVTIDVPAETDGLALPNLTVTVPNAQNRMIGPFPKALYTQSDGTVYVNTSAQTNVSYAAIKAGSKSY